jgi:hypothetical protein
MSTPHYWLQNSLNGWKLEFQRELRKDRKRLETLRAMSHPVTEDQERLIQIKDGWVKQIEAEMSALAPADRGGAA